MRHKEFFGLITSSLKQWNEDNISHLAAAISYYTIFSLAPVLVICIIATGFFFGQEIVSEHVLEQITQALGQDTAFEIKTIMESIQKPSSNLLTSLIGVITLVWGMANLFSELQNSFNHIWKVETKKSISWTTIIVRRFFSFSIILGLGFLLLVSLLFSALLAAFVHHFHHIIPNISHLWIGLDFLFSVISLTLLLAFLFKILPDVVLKWRDVFPGAFVTALLFALGKFFLSIYLSKSNITSTYGAAASLVVILIWVYYSAQILLFGAEFTKAYTMQYGSHFRLNKNTK